MTESIVNFCYPWGSEDIIFYMHYDQLNYPTWKNNYNNVYNTHNQKLRDTVWIRGRQKETVIVLIKI